LTEFDQVLAADKSDITGVFDVFGFGHWLWSQGLREAGKHARALDDATPQSACSAGKQSRSATLSTLRYNGLPWFAGFSMKYPG
jgi:hypothetical protein